MSLVHSLLGASAACRHASVPCMCSASACSRLGQVEGLRYASTSRTSSRTRLAKDLTPRPPRSRDFKDFQKPSKLLDVARRGPKPEPFSRDSAPHRERRDSERSQYAKKPDYANKYDRAPRDFKSKGRESRPSWGDRMSREADASASHSNSFAPRPRSTAPSSVTEEEGIEAEFDFSTPAEPRRGLPKQFSSPPLLEGLVESVHDLLGQDVRPTPIQSLSLKHLFTEPEDGKWREFLLASETGSGKSLAYLLPVLQALKQTELSQPTDQPGVRHSPNVMRPRAIVLAPTHELSRQLAGFAKALIHHIKLRVTTASRSNVASTAKTSEMEIRKAGAGMTASKMAEAFGNGAEDGEFEVRKGAQTHAVDLLVGTPSKVLEMVKGRGWDRDDAGEGRIGRPEMSLDRVEWVVVDEADILFDPDFVEETRLILADIAKARGKPVPTEPITNPPTQSTEPMNYPFNLLLTSATIPSSLASYLDRAHPAMTRLVSPDLHRLPSTLALEFTPYTSGNRAADVERKIRDVWLDDAHAGRPPAKIIVFGNKRTRVDEVGAFLKEKGIPCVVITGAGAGGRVHGSNRHLAGFLRALPGTGPAQKAEKGKDGDAPRVLLSTSLLARGLDFAPDVSHVFVLDPPRNTADFMHRAGRTARAGLQGKVVVFRKEGGRGAEKGRDLKKRVEALKARK